MPRQSQHRLAGEMGGKARKPLLMLLPLPPPYAGPESMASSMVKSMTDMGLQDYGIVNSTLRRENKAKGRLNLQGVLSFIPVLFRYLGKLTGSEVVFMYICSSKIGFLRDSLYILLARLFGKKVLVQYHGGNFRSFYMHRSSLYRAFVRSVLRRTESILVLGRPLVRMFDEIVPEAAVQVLCNGVDPGEFSLRDRRADRQFTVCYLGHLTFPKGFYDLVLAYRKLRARHGDDISMLFAGERVGYKKALSRFLDDRWSDYYLSNIDLIVGTMLEFTEHCGEYNAEYLGVIDRHRKAEFFDRACLFVIPSYSEGLSISCIEAMASGLPVISTPVGAMSEIVIEQEGGLLTEVGNPDDLASRIDSLFSSRELCHEMGAFNRRFVEEHLDVRAIAGDLHGRLLSSTL
jgi:glycosyltransferase involved in cell wall biosynthesis